MKAWIDANFDLTMYSFCGSVQLSAKVIPRFSLILTFLYCSFLLLLMDFLLGYLFWLALRKDKETLAVRSLMHYWSCYLL